MAKKFLNNIDLNGTLTIAGSGGTNGYFLKTDGTGVISWAAASGGGSGFTGAGTSITNITGAASNNMTITSAASGNGTLTLLPSGQGNIYLNSPYTTRPAGSVSIVGQVPTGVNGGHIYIQSAYAGSGAPGNIYIDGQYDEVSSRGNIYIGTGVDGATSASGAVYLGTTGIPLYIDGYIANPLKVSGNSAGTSGQFLKSNGTGGPPSWVTSSTVTSYTVLGSTTFSGTAPSFSSISASYKKLVMTIVFSSIGTFSGALLFTAGTSSASAVPYVRWATSSGTGVSNAGTSGMAISGTVAPVANLLYVVEIPNYTGNSVTCWGSGGNNFAVGSVSAASTGIAYAAFTAVTSWGTAAGTATLYGVN